MTDMKTNKLSIYLIKDGVDFEKIIKEKNDIFCKNIALKSRGDEKDIIGRVEEKGKFYYKKSRTREPEWFEKFFDKNFKKNFNNEDGGDEKFKMHASSASGVLIVPFIIKGKKITFALCFGYGRTMLNENVYVEGFGLRVVLNTVDEEKIKSIDKIDISAFVAATEQGVNYGYFHQFSIDEEHDLIKKVTGKASEEYSKFGSLMTGKDAFSVSIKSNTENLNTILSDCYKYYQLQDYLTKFPWIGNIQKISDLNTMQKLEAELLKKIELSNFKNLWMSTPEIIDFSETEGYICNKTEFEDDFSIEDVFNVVSIKNAAKSGVEELKNIKFSCQGSADDLPSWSIWKCLSGEFNDKNKADTKILLIFGEWYEVKTNVVKKIEKQFDEILEKSKDYFITNKILPDCNKKLGRPSKGRRFIEQAYNENVAQQNSNFLCLDRKLVAPNGKKKQIEFCDLLMDNNIIHVKLYNKKNPSQKFSHFFAQGIVSATLFLNDAEFRKDVNRAIKEVKNNSKNVNNTCNFSAPTEAPISSDYSIIYAVIEDEKPFDMPIFSKINFIKGVKYLQERGFIVYLYKIDVI